MTCHRPGSHAPRNTTRCSECQANNMDHWPWCSLFRRFGGIPPTFAQAPETTD
jgi:hypothetical protein